MASSTLRNMWEGQDVLLGEQITSHWGKKPYTSATTNHSSPSFYLPTLKYFFFFQHLLVSSSTPHLSSFVISISLTQSSGWRQECGHLVGKHTEVLPNYLRNNRDRQRMPSCISGIRPNRHYRLLLA
jgi:hypothetical protein